MLFVTSDLHLFHRNIIRLCDRPYRDLEHMHPAMREAWNKVVQPSDTVYVLGDLCMSARTDAVTAAVNALNGYKYLVPGNHDKKVLNKVVRFLKNAEVTDSIIEITSGDTRYVMCHYPIETWNRRHHGAIHLHGHSHGRGTFVHNRVDVGWDVFGKPMPIKETIVSEYKQYIETRAPTTDYHE